MAVVAAAWTAVSSFAASIGITSTLGSMLLSTAVSAISTHLQRQRMANRRQPGIRSEYTTEGDVQPQSFVVGTYATPGHMVCPPMSHGRVGDHSNAFLTYVMAVSDVPGAQLQKVIVNDEEVTFAAANQAIPQGGLIPTGMPAEWYQRQGMDPANPAASQPSLTPGRPATGRLAGACWLRYLDGRQTAADPFLLSAYGPGTDWDRRSGRPWTSDMVGVGTCYAVLTFEFDPELYKGLPRVRFELAGVPLYDPRRDSSVGGNGSHRWNNPATWEPTRNGMLIAYNILRGIPIGGGPLWGYGAAAEDLPTAAWFPALNAASQVVDGAMRWQAGYEIGVEQEPAEVLDEVLKVCCAKVAEVGGTWKPRVGPPAAPVAWISDDDLLADQETTFTPFPALEQTWNGVQASFPDPGSLWRPKDAPPRYNPAWEAADGGQRRVAELDLSACPWPAQVQRVMAAYINEERRFRRHVIVLPPQLEAIEPLDVISWTSNENGYQDKLFEVTEVAQDPVTMAVTLSVAEVDPADYDWTPGMLLPSPPASVVAVRPAPVVPTSFSVRGLALKDDQGRPRRPALQILWGGWALQGVTSAHWEVRRTGETDTMRGMVGDPAVGEVVVAGLIAATNYQARLSFIGRRGVPVAWTPWTTARTPDVRLEWADFTADVQAELALNDARIEGAEADAENASRTAQQVLTSLRSGGALLRTSNTITSPDGTRTAGIESYILNPDGTGVGSAVLLRGDLVIAPGTLATEQLIVGIGRNLLVDPDFQDGLAHWVFSTSGGATGALRAPGGQWAHPAWPTLMIEQLSGAQVASFFVATPVVTANGGRAPGVPVRVGRAYTVSAYLSAHRAVASLGINWMDVNGNVLSTIESARVDVGPGSSISPDTWVRLHASAIAPADAVYAQVFARKGGTTSGDSSFLFIWKPQLEEVAYLGQMPAPWSPGGTTFVNGGRLFADSVDTREMRAGAVTTKHVTADTMRALNGRFASLAAANVTLGNAEVDTLHVRGQAIRASVSGTASTAVSLAAGNDSTVLSVALGREGYKTFITATAQIDGASGGAAAVLFSLWRGTVKLVEWWALTGLNGSQDTSAFRFEDADLGSGAIQYHLRARSPVIQNYGGVGRVLLRSLELEHSKR